MAEVPLKPAPMPTFLVESSTDEPAVTPAPPSVDEPLDSSEPPKYRPWNAAPMPVTSSIRAFSSDTVLVLDTESVVPEPCVDCRPIGSVTDTTYGVDGAGLDKCTITLPRSVTIRSVAAFVTCNVPSVIIS